MFEEFTEAYIVKNKRHVRTLAKFSLFKDFEGDEDEKLRLLRGLLRSEIFLVNDRNSPGRTHKQLRNTLEQHASLRKRESTRGSLCKVK